MVSKSVVLPWSTWPIIVTTGGLGTKSSLESTISYSSKLVMSWVVSFFNVLLYSKATIWADSKSTGIVRLHITPILISLVIRLAPLHFSSSANSWTVMLSWYKITLSSLAFFFSLDLFLYISFLLLKNSCLLCASSLFFFSFCFLLPLVKSLVKLVVSKISSTASSITSSSSKDVSLAVDIKFIVLSNIIISSSLKVSVALLTLIPSSLHFFKISATELDVSLAYSFTLII